jgi:hypothetical protein
MPYFTKAIDKYFANWILTDTWFTHHESDDNRFYRFVLALDFFSRPIRNAHWQDKYKDGFRSIYNKGLLRNPRTSDSVVLKKKIILTVQRNHNFNDAELVKYADEFANRAIIILDCLWLNRSEGLKRLEFNKYNPGLK